MSERAWFETLLKHDQDTFVVFPLAAGGVRRTLRRGFLGEDVDVLTSVASVVDEAWPGWRRTLREDLGFGAGIAGNDADAANREGRQIAELAGLSGSDWSGAHSAVTEAYERWINDDVEVLNLLAAAGMASPDVGSYDIAVRFFESLRPLYEEDADKDEHKFDHRNVIALGLRIGYDEVAKDGRIVDAVRAYLGLDAPGLSKSERRQLWSKFRALGPETAAQMNADCAREVLSLAPLPADAAIGRLTPGVFRASLEFLNGYNVSDERTARTCEQVVRSFVRRATEAGDHGDLINDLRRLNAHIRRDGLPPGIENREFGGMLRALEGAVVDRRDALEAEAQRQLATQSGVGWGTNLSHYSDGRIDVIELTTAEALAEEGAVMRHCVGGYADMCRSGRSVIWSLRIDGARVATTDLQPPDESDPDGRWRIRQLSGFRNGAPSQEIREVANRLVEQHRGHRPCERSQDD